MSVARGLGLLQPRDEFVTDQLGIDLVVGAADPLPDVPDDHQAGVAEPVADVLQEREVPALIAHADEEEVHLVAPLLGLGEHLFGARLVAVVAIGDEDHDRTTPSGSRFGSRLAPEETAEHAAGLGLVAVGQPTEVLE